MNRAHSNPDHCPTAAFGFGAPFGAPWSPLAEARVVAESGQGTLQGPKPALARFACDKEVPAGVPDHRALETVQAHPGVMQVMAAPPTPHSSVREDVATHNSFEVTDPTNCLGRESNTGDGCPQLKMQPGPKLVKCSTLASSVKERKMGVCVFPLCFFFSCPTRVMLLPRPLGTLFAEERHC